MSREPSAPASVKLSQTEFNRQLWRAVVPPLIFLAVHAGLIAILFLFFVRTNAASRNADAVLTSISETERLMANMETGMRGYLLTGENTFLSTYKASEPQMEPTLSSMRKLVEGNKAQGQAVEEVQSLYRQWIATEAELPKPSMTIDPKLGKLLETRKGLMDQIRAVLHDMAIRQSGLRSDGEDSAVRMGMIVVFGGISLSIIMAVGLALINRRTVIRLSTTYQRAVNEELAVGSQFMDLAESIPHLIWISDGTGKNLYFNGPFSDVTGRSQRQLTDLGWMDLLHPDDRAQVQMKWARSVESGEAFEGEYRLKHAKDGTYRWFQCKATSVVDAAGRRTKWFGSCTDIEDQKQVAKERELALSAERAARSDLLRNSRAKDEFLATLSHELRTPMTAILGWAKLLRDPKVRETSLEHAISAIDANARAQTRLIEDLLDMSRINAGKLALKTEVFDLTPVVKAAIDSVSPAAVNKRVAIELDVPESPVQVRGDAARIQQVVWNLLTNAVKFTPTGGHVWVTLDRSDVTARLEVKDAGKGIDPEFLPHVFQRFRQEDGSTTRAHGGLGLGLTIVQQLVEMHGGTVTAASAGLGRGAVFAVELPLGSAAVTTGRPPVDNPAEVLVGKRVLLVDDDTDSMTVLRLILEGVGCKVMTAGGAMEALSILQSSTFDVLVSDIGMPEMDGYTLMRRWREIEPKGQRLPAIACTAFARGEDKAAALAADFQLHVVKPVMPDDLIRAISMLVDADTQSVA